MLIERNKILHYFESQGAKALAARLLDQVSQVLRHYEPRYTDFLDPQQQRIALEVIKSINDIDCALCGGYEDAERCRLKIFPDYLEPNMVEDKLAFIGVRGKFEFQKVNHRDYLGALLNLGLKREKLGDILVHELGCDLIVVPEVKDYIFANLSKVNKIGVGLVELNQDQITLPAPSYKLISGTVASERLDAVAAVAFGIARSQVITSIKAGNLKLNWQECLDPSKQVFCNDILSFKGKGRAKVDEIGGVTKKGRISIKIKRFQ